MMKNKFTGEEIDNEESAFGYITTRVTPVKNQLEHELNRPVSFREAMVEMKLDQKTIDRFSTRYNIDSKHNTFQDESKCDSTMQEGLPELNDE